MKLHSLDDMLDRDIGPVGTKTRDEFEKQVSDEIHAYHVGGKTSRYDFRVDQHLVEVPHG